MFTTCFGDAVDFPPTVETTRVMRNNFVQTEPFTNENVECQFPTKKNVQLQTEISEDRKIEMVDFNPESLMVFLNRVTPLVTTMLERNIRSHAFDRYNLLMDIDSSSTQQLHSLKYFPPVPEVHCADISWNTTGTALAVAYSSKDHENWCDHDSSIAVWNILRKDFKPSKPNTVLETDCCVTAISFHPKLPALLAGGNFNGQVMLWNIAKEDDMFMALSGSGAESHREPISELHWFSDAEDVSKYKLVSCSLDGKIIMWRFDEKKHLLEAKDGWIILADLLPRNLGIKSIRPGAEVGVTSMSFNCEDPSIYIVGAEGGTVFQCSMNSQTFAFGIPGDLVQFKHPVVMVFERHKGQVNSVHFSPFARNLFLTAGSDGELHICSLLQPKPILKLQLPVGVRKAQWSPTRPLVIAAVCEDGKLYFWDLAQRKSTPTQFHSLSEDGVDTIGSALCFDNKNHQLFATGAGDGSVQVWQLAVSLTQAESHEKELLLKLEELYD